MRHDKLILDKKRKSTTPGKGVKNMSASMRRSTGNLSSSQKDLTDTSKSSSGPSFMKATSSSSAKRAPP